MYKYDCETTSYVGYDNTRVPPVIVITLAMNMIPHFELLPAITLPSAPQLLLSFKVSCCQEREGDKSCVFFETHECKRFSTNSFLTTWPHQAEVVKTSHTMGMRGG